MKLKKIMAVAVGVLSIGALTSCGSDPDAIVDDGYILADQGVLKTGYTLLANTNQNGKIVDGKYTAGGIKFTTKDLFKTTYSTEPTKDLFNYLCNTWTYNSYHYCNMVDGLVENDKYGNIVGALALGYKVTENADGTQTWSFQLRENAEWVNNKTGAKVANVTAEDFVSGAKYVLNPANGSGTQSLMTGFINGAEDYVAALAAYQAGTSEEKPSFETVGVKATGTYTIEYTLKQATPYFSSVLTYSPYLPVYQEFLDEEGTEFGKTVNDILVNGAFRITTHKYEDHMTYTKNYHYYDREHVYFNHVTRTFVPGTAILSTTREWFEAGTIDSFTVNENDEVGWNKYVVGDDTENPGTLKNPANPICNAIQSYGASTYIGYFNYNRTFYEFASDVTSTTAEQRTDTMEALANTSFRQGFLYGLDVIQYLKRYSSSEPYNYLMRGYTNKELSSAGGKDYTDYVTAAYNSHEGTSIDSLIGIDNGGDPIYNAEKAKAKFQAAYDQLKDTVTFPVRIDYLGSMKAKLQAYEKEMLKSLTTNAVADDGNGNKVNLIEIGYNVPSSNDQNTSWGSESSNFDFSMWSGWGPDYADPNSYLHTMAIYGDMVDYTGFPTSEADLANWELSEYAPKKYQDMVIVKEDGSKDYSAAVSAYQNDIYGTYNTKYLAGASVTDPTQTVDRYQKFAEAEYELIFGLSLIVPWYSENGYYASVSKTVPWQAGRATYGLTSDKFKNVICVDDTITKDQRKAVTDEYNAGK